MYSQVADFAASIATRWTLLTDPVVRNTIEGWCLSQLAPWFARPFPAPDEAAYHEINAQQAWTFLFRLSSRGVARLDKPAAADTGGALAHRRAEYYRAFFERVVRQAPLPQPLLIAVDVADIATASGHVPIFSFQKVRGGKNILVPDVDFLLSTNNSRPSWLTADWTPWRRKRHSAVFAGSTTGGLITPHAIGTNAIPRLRAGLFFRDKPEVDFRLPGIVDCDSEATAAMLRQMGFGGPPVSWQSQFQHKFILSMDGNGATCSRIVTVLRSGSVLLKYASPHELYYFPSLRPWQHFIPVETDQDVLHILALAEREPAMCRAIAREGQRFYRAFLGRRAVDHYMGRLLQLYAGLLRDRVVG